MSKLKDKRIVDEEEIIPDRTRQSRYADVKVVESVAEEEQLTDPLDRLPPPPHLVPGETIAETHNRKWRDLITVMEIGLELRLELLSVIGGHQTAAEHRQDEPPASNVRERAEQLRAFFEDLYIRYSPVLFRLTNWQIALDQHGRATSCMFFDGNPSREIDDLRAAIRRPWRRLSAISPAPTVDVNDLASMEAATKELREVTALVREMEEARLAFATALELLVEKFDRYVTRWNEPSLGTNSAFQPIPPVYKTLLAPDFTPPTPQPVREPRYAALI